MILSEWREFPSAPCLAGGWGGTWWQLASRCCWNRARPCHASELVSFLIGLRTYQHPRKDSCNRCTHLMKIFPFWSHLLCFRKKHFDIVAATISANEVRLCVVKGKPFLQVRRSMMVGCVISGFRREVDENCSSLLVYYAASSGNFLSTFRRNLSVQGFLTAEDGAVRLSWNVGKKLPILAS